MINNTILAAVSAIVLYIGLYLHRKCEKPELFEKNTFVYSVVTGIVVFVGLNYYKTAGEPGVYVPHENIITEPFIKST
jgi:hypothetical protein